MVRTIPNQSEANPIAANSADGAQAKVATSEKLVGGLRVCARFDLSKPFKLPCSQKRG
jgi:hypothetical protein